MMDDSKDFKMLDSLMRENELIFRLGITHLISVGYENLTEEALEQRKKKEKRSEARMKKINSMKSSPS